MEQQRRTVMDQPQSHSPCAAGADGHRGAGNYGVKLSLEKRPGGIKVFKFVFVSHYPILF